MTEAEGAVGRGECHWLMRAIAVNRRQHPRGIAVVFWLMFEVLPHSRDAHTTNAAGEVSARPDGFGRGDFTRRVGLHDLNEFGDCVCGPQA